MDNFANNVTMQQFYGPAGPLYVTISGWRGEPPRRTHWVQFSHDKGCSEYDGARWVHHLYTAEEQQRIDAERAVA